MIQTVSTLSRIGLAATVAIILILGLAAVREPSRQGAAQNAQQIRALEMGTDLYALHCAESQTRARNAVASDPAPTRNQAHALT